MKIDFIFEKTLQKFNGIDQTTRANISVALVLGKGTQYNLLVNKCFAYIFCPQNHQLMECPTPKPKLALANSQG